MKEYAFIFRQTPVRLTDEQQKQRAEEVAKWATRLRDAGHTMSPHLLGSERVLFASQGLDSSARNPQAGDPVVAILVASFASFDDAKRAASTHPGLHYGVTIEVRDARAPQFRPAQPVAVAK